MSKALKLLLSTAVFVLLLGLFAGYSFADAIKTGVITGDDVNIREARDTSSEVLDQISEGAKVSIYSVTDGWCKISYGKITGWVYAEYIKETSLGTGTVTGDGVNLRSEAKTSSKVLDTLDKGQKVTVISTSGEWFKVKTSSGTTGWVIDNYLVLSKSTSSKVSRGDDSSSSSSSTSSDSTSGQRMVTFAKKYLGVRYVYGGESPSGFDCSGFTQYVYSHYSIRLNRTAADQATQGDRVSKANLRPGDLVFFDTNGGHNYINHAGLYIGGGEFIHASSGKGRVTISSLTEGFYEDAYMSAKRIID
jgi:cell wall-associated NlpC family hydrolase